MLYQIFSHFNFLSRLGSNFLLLIFLSALPAQLLAQSTHSAPYDVIIRQDGTIVTGKILEVNLFTIKYQRLDMPDGPLVEIPRNIVYAITYRNQLTEYLMPVDSAVFYKPEGQAQKSGPKSWDERWYAHLDSGRMNFGIGFIRAFSMINNVESLSNRGGSIGYNLGYSFPVRRNIEVGILAGLASFRYLENRVSEYDQFQIRRDIKENIFSLAAIGIYRLGLGKIDPYVLGGLAFYSSRANSDGTIQFLDDLRTVSVQNSAAGTSFGFLVRGGVSFHVNSKSGAYFDVGNGITLLQLGGYFKLDLK